MEFNDKKKYCFALDLKNDPEKIQAYIDHHKRVWPEIKESIKGIALVKDVFKSPKFGAVAGSVVEEGTISSKMNVRVLRDNIVIHEGILDSLRRFKDEAKEVKSGTECGIGISNYSDIKIGDRIEVFEREEIKRRL